MTQAKRLIYPAFSLDRPGYWQIPENAFWELQTYIGLRDELCVNDGAQNFLFESTRERTPLGHVHRHHLRQLSVDAIRETYRNAVNRMLAEAVKYTELVRWVTVAIDTTTADPLTGDRTGYEDEIIGTKEADDEYAYQWATIQVVGEKIPLVLDARSVRREDTREEIVVNLLESTLELVNIDILLMDREFDRQNVLDAVRELCIHYLVPKRKRTSEKAKQLERRDADNLVKECGLHLGKNEWHETTLIYLRKQNWTETLREGHERYVVFMTRKPFQRESVGQQFASTIIDGTSRVDTRA